MCVCLYAFLCVKCVNICACVYVRKERGCACALVCVPLCMWCVCVSVCVRCVWVTDRDCVCLYDCFFVGFCLRYLPRKGKKNKNLSNTELFDFFHSFLK